MVEVCLQTQTERVRETPVPMQSGPLVEYSFTPFLIDSTHFSRFWRSLESWATWPRVNEVVVARIFSDFTMIFVYRFETIVSRPLQLRVSEHEASRFDEWGHCPAIDCWPATGLTNKSEFTSFCWLISLSNYLSCGWNTRTWTIVSKLQCLQRS